MTGKELVESMTSIMKEHDDIGVPSWDELTEEQQQNWNRVALETTTEMGLDLMEERIEQSTKAIIQEFENE